MTRTKTTATRSQRDLGAEILAGIQEIKRGEQGRRAPSGAARCY